MNSIIQEFLDKGYINKEAAARLEDFESQVKEAGFVDNIWSGTKSFGRAVLPALPIALGSLLGGVAVNHFSKKELEDISKKQEVKLDQSFNKMMLTNPTLQKSKELSAERFNEIALISPTVALNPSVAGKLVQKTLKRGLDTNEMSVITQIHKNVVTSKVKKPSTVMGSMAEKGLETAGMMYSQHLANTMSGEDDGSSFGAGGSSDLPPGTPAGTYKFDPNAKRILGSATFKPEKPMDMLYGAVVLKKRGLLKDDLNALKIGFNEEDFARNNLMQENLNRKVAETLSWLKLTVDQVRDEATGGVYKKASDERAGVIVADNYLLSKYAGTKAPILLGNVLKGLAGAAVFGGTMGLVEEGFDFARSKQKKKDLTGSWGETSKNLKRLSIDLPEQSSGIDYTDKKVQDKALETFNVLSHVAPSLATNPTIATSFVHTIMERHSMISPDFIKMLAETQKNMSVNSEYKSPFAKSPTMSGFTSGFGSAGGTKLIEKGVEGLVI